MWYIEIVCSKEWLSGKIQPDKSIVYQDKIILTDGNKDFLGEGVVYASNNELHALRIIMDSLFDKGLADILCDYNAIYWQSVIENFIRISGDSLFNIYTLLPNSIIITYGEGDHTNKPLEIKQLGVPERPKLDFTIVIQSMKAFPREYKLYMQYFNRFTNKLIPLEMRWLNGYKIFELYYKYPLGKNAQWIQFLEEWRSEISPFLKTNQTLSGFIESVRSDAAHAVNHINYKEDLIAKTLPILSKMLAKFLDNLKKTSDIQFFTNIK
jgi:hypothetical protein